MTAPPERGPGQRSQAQALAELRERADAQIRTLATGEDWARWLRIAARFPGWTFTNVMLIAAQRPDAALLAGYQEWQVHGRQVRNGEPGIAVITEPGRPPAAARPAAGMDRPTVSSRRQAGRDDCAPGTLMGTARVAYVWDISQISGPRLAGPAAPLPGQGTEPAGLWEALTWLARREGFAVERTTSDEAGSETIWAARRVRISAQPGGPAAVHALLHELGHILAHGRVVHVPGESTAACQGVRKVEAGSAAFIAAARLGLDTSFYEWPFVASWAGSDPRARPEKAVEAAGARISRAAAVIISHVDRALLRRAAGGSAAVPKGKTEPLVSDEAIRLVLEDAERFYARRLAGSWAAGYLAGRGVGPGGAARWRAGYAPPGWSMLTGHLRRAGHADAVIEAAGLARRWARGTLIDVFRDRVVFAVCDGQGRAAGFIGRARPSAAAGTPKYVNSPQTPVYRKGQVLFGLGQARELLAAGAVPVIVEGPFDAIAVTMAGGGRYAGVAPCGTALTAAQVAALASVADLDRVGVVVALDGDRAGRDATVRAYAVLAAHTSRLSAAVLPDRRDPAQILETSGAQALVEALARTGPLAQVVIDAHLDEWGPRLEHPEGQLAAMRSGVQVIAAALPERTVEAIRRTTGRQAAGAADEDVPGVPGAVVAEVARVLPAGAICQIIRLAARTGCECSDVTAEVASVTVRDARTPKPRLATAGSRNAGLRPPPQHQTAAGTAVAGRRDRAATRRGPKFPAPPRPNRSLL